LDLVGFSLIHLDLNDLVAGRAGSPLPAASWNKRVIIRFMKLETKCPCLILRQSDATPAPAFKNLASIWVRFFGHLCAFIGLFEEELGSFRNFNVQQGRWWGERTREPNYY